MDYSSMTKGVWTIIGIVLAIFIGFIGLTIVLQSIAQLINPLVAALLNVSVTNMSFASFFAASGPVQLLFGGMIVIAVIALIVVLILGATLSQETLGK